MASGFVDPFNYGAQWNVVVIAGQISPGLAIVGEAKRKNTWDQKNAKGMLGTVLTYAGKPAAKFSVEFQLWTLDHFVAFEQFRTILKYDPTKTTAQALDIFHPSLADIDIYSVVTEEIGNIVHKGQGLYSCTISFIEFLPTPKASAVSTPTMGMTTAGQTAQGTIPGNPVQGAINASQAQIAALLQQAQAP
jgi:hypothetical protein